MRQCRQTWISMLLAVLFAWGIVLFPQDKPAQIPADEHMLDVQSFEYVWKTVFEKHFDPTFGEVVWAMSAMAGPQLKEGKEKAISLHLNTFDRLAYWRKSFKKVETSGLETVNGRSCYKVLATPHEAPPQTLFFDRETHLLSRLTMTIFFAVLRRIGYCGCISVEASTTDMGSDGPPAISLIREGTKKRDRGILTKKAPSEARAPEPVASEPRRASALIGVDRRLIISRLCLRMSNDSIRTTLA